MNCSCFKSDAGETIVRDPWCAWHGDIEMPPICRPGTVFSYEIKWPQHFNCRCFVEPIVPGQYFGKMEGI